MVSGLADAATGGSDLLLGAFIGATFSFVVWCIQSWFERRRRKKEEKQQRASLLTLYALEAVRLFQRFVQYCDQGTTAQISFSRPYEFLPPTAIPQLVLLGVERPVLDAIYQVRQLNDLVTRQVDRAYDELSHRQVEPGEIYDDVLENVPTPLGPVGTPYVTFARIFTFVHDEYATTRTAVQTILTAAAKETSDEAVRELRKSVEASEARYSDVLKRFPAPQPPK